MSQREMKKYFAFFVAFVSCMAANGAMAAVNIKKAAPVATQESSMTSTASSLVPTVLGLVSDVQALSAKQRELDAECIPSSAEIEFVNNAMKEWAKTGAVTATEIARKLNQTPCPGGSCYEADVRYNAGTDSSVIRYDNFASKADENMVWYQFPRASKATYCPDGSITCSSKEQKTVSNIYEIFDLIDFGAEDYTKQEATMAAKLLARTDSCSDTLVSKKKKEMWGEFITTTMGNMGQKTNTSTIMQTVGNITKSNSGLGGGLSSLGSIASQFMDK